MKKLFLWFRNISISKKLYFTVGIMAILIGIELFTLFFSLNTLSAVRAYVGGEGLWSKAQKDATLHLYKYGITHEETNYLHFKEFMKVVLGDSKTRHELGKPSPDWTIAKKGFKQGRIHEDDIDGMIWLFRKFSNVSYINKAIFLWGEAESRAIQLIPIGEQIHNEIISSNPSQEKINDLLREVESINNGLTVFEDGFSYTLGEGSRWLENLIMKLLLFIALTVEITGLLLAISVSKNIQKGLQEIISASLAFAKGTLGVRAKVFSRDEIGIVAESFNQMSFELEQKIKELDQAQKKFKGLLETAPDAIIIVNKEGDIKIVNAQTENLFGYSKNELLEQSIEILIPNKFQKINSLNRKIYFEFLRLHARDMNIGLFGKKKNGIEFPIEISLSPIETEEGLLISAAVRDISEREYIKQLENKNKELEQFAYIASHDMQEPLVTMNSFITLLEENSKEKLNSEATDYLSYIKESSDRLRALISGLLEYSRIGKSSQLSTVDCNELVKEVITDMEAIIKSDNARINISDLPTITAYKVEIRLLFQNLISNALKYRKKDRAPVINIYAVEDEKYWIFTIEDNGIGIEEKYWEKIFIIFQRLHSNLEYSGTGIGLAHCKKIIEMHKGKLWLESVTGKGTIFHFSIPKH